MAFLRPALLVVVIAASLNFATAQQPADNQTLFTISVAAPTKAKEVQLRYFYKGETDSLESSVASSTDDNKIVIKTGVEGKTAKTLRLVAYAPGCQFVTISVDDLSSTHQGEFQCTRLNTVQFNGRVSTSSLGHDKLLEVRILYNCDWCPQFFGMATGALSPFTLGKADIDSDGTFVTDLPDFSADPTWSTFSSKASLSFYLFDSIVMEQTEALKSLSGTPGTVPVAPFYSPVEFRPDRVIDDRIQR